MKGEIFNLFEAFLVDAVGQAAVQDLYDTLSGQLQTSEPFVGPGTYPDRDFMTIVTNAIESFHLTQSDAMRNFGRFCFPRLAQKMPGYVEKYSHPKDFLKTLHSVIHVEVKKVYSDATPPHFSYQDPGPEELVMIYKSPRRLYDFVDGMLDGAADFFNVPITSERILFNDGEDEVCAFHLRFG